MRLFALTVLCAFGLSLCAIGCSDPVAPIPAGGWSAAFQHTSGTCNINAHNAGVGQVSSDGKTVLVTDGIDDASVVCSVTPASGGTFNVQASATKNGQNVSISIKGMSKTATATAPVQGTVAYVSPTTADNFTSPGDAPCNFYFVDGTKETIAAGNIWVAFECPKIADTNNVCALTGYAKFENCDGTPTQN
jgi:hypothetical protein